MNKNDKNKKGLKKISDPAPLNTDMGSVNFDVLGSYTGIPINEKMISKNVSGGKTYMRLYSSNEVSTQDADDL